MNFRTAFPLLLTFTMAACGGGSEENPVVETDTGTLETGAADTGAPDTELADTELADSATADSELADSALADSATADSSSTDSATADSTTADSTTADSAPTDSGSTDAADSSAADSTSDVSDATDAAPDVPSETCGSSTFACMGGCAPITTGTVQLDASSVLTHDVVRNTGDTTQDSMDGSAYCLMTAAYAMTRSAAGLPNDGTFAATSGHPAVVLPISDTNNGPNARVLTAGQTFSLAVAPRAFTKLFVWLTGTEGGAATSIVIHYCDGTSETRTITTPDWFADPAPTGFVYLIDNLSRFSTGDSAVPAGVDPAIFGYNVAPNPAKVVTSIDMTNTGTGGRRVVFFGATGSN